MDYSKKSGTREESADEELDVRRGPGGDHEPENEYSDDEFEYDEVIETEAFIQYNATIGPNIIVSKSNSNKRTPRFSTTSSKKILSSRSRSIRPKTLTGTPNPNSRRNQTFVKRPAKTPNTSSLQSEFQKLSLDVDVMFPASRGSAPSMHFQRSAYTPNVRVVEGSRSSVAIRAPKRQSVFQQRLNSAKKIQMKDMMSKFRLLENTIDTLTVENRTLRTLHHRQDIALRKYEGAESDFPRLLEHHANEVQSLQRGLRKAQGTLRENDEKVRSLNYKIVSLKKENARFQVLVRLNELDEREKLVKQVQEMETQLAEGEKKGNEFRRRYEILEKNQNRQFGGMQAKLRASNNRLFAAEKEIDRQSDLLRQKDKVINYLRMRGSRYTDLEPPIMRKMSEVSISTYKPYLKSHHKQEMYVECEEPHNPANRSNYPPDRTHIPKMQFSIRRIYEEKREMVRVPRQKPKYRNVVTEEEENYSVAGSGRSEVHSVSSCGSRLELETGRTCELDVSRGSMSPSYSEENLETWTGRQRVLYQKQEQRERGEQEENDMFEESDVSRGYLEYKGGLKSRAYSEMDINTLRGCNSESVLVKKGGGRGAVYESLPRAIKEREREDNLVQEKAQEPEQVEPNDVPHEGAASEPEPEDMKRIETCPMDGGGDATPCTPLGSEPEFGFFHQSSYDTRTEVSVSRELSSSGSSAYGFVEEELESDAKAYDKERELFTPIMSVTAMRPDETDEEDDKVMHRILEAVLERSEKVEQQARLISPYQIVREISNPGSPRQASNSRNISPQMDLLPLSPHRTIPIHFPENSIMDKLKNSANVAKSRAFALSSPFYTFSSKLSQLDESESASDTKYILVGPNARTIPEEREYSNQRGLDGAEYTSQAEQTETEPDSSPKPRIQPSLRPTIEIDEEEDMYNFEQSHEDLLKFEQTLNSFYKSIKTPARSTFSSGDKRICNASNTGDSWSLATILKPDSGSAISQTTEMEEGPGGSANSPRGYNRNGLLKGFANAAPTGNVTSTKDKNSTQPTRRYKSNWE